jgi:hypothetical protein
MKIDRWMTAAAVVFGSLFAPTVAEADPNAATTIGTSLPSDFPFIRNPYLGVPVLGFGARGHVERIPVIFLHGNNDTPFPTSCNPFGYIRNVAQHLLASGYRPSELWGLGYRAISATWRPRSRASRASRTALPRPCR